MRICIAAAVCQLAFLGSISSAAEASKFMMQATIDGVRVEGSPLFWSQKQVLLLARDGYLWDFKPTDAKDFRKTGFQFRSYSITEMQDRLRRELGPSFEVTSTGHYLVAHPKGQRDQWAQRFEELYRSFVVYFRTRGFEVREPEFPLVAVACKNQQEFLRQASREGPGVSTSVLGYYSMLTNRVLLFDVSGGKTSSAARQQNLDTIIHEAAHQIAFNTGIHNRFSPPPRWVTEGLGTAFEAPGVWNPRSNTRQIDRVNRGRFDDFKHLLSKRKAGTTAELIASDRLFDSNPAAAYAEAWALTFFLAETQPRDYSKYLARTAARDPFEEYSSIERTADFTAIFGDNFRLLEARFLRYMESLN